MVRAADGTLRVDGATIHFKTAGRGPVLLLLPGGDGDADAFDLSLPDLSETRDAPAVWHYHLDLSRLAPLSDRIVPAAGINSADAWPHRAASALADALGRPLVRFAGDHAGFVRHPRSFAARCRDLFSPYLSS